ncbi:MAG: DNA adenine methylase [Bdellovibrionota bacterium]
MATESQIQEQAAPLGAEVRTARPFLKWAGGKTALLPELLKRVPKDFNAYFEPFLGGGALFFALAPEKAFLSDANSDVINVFRAVRDKLPDLIANLAKHSHSKRYYYKLRNLDRGSDFWVLSDVERASRLIYLNKTCFNGLYRVNSRGEFNVPFGAYQNPKFLDRENLESCNRVLQNADLSVGSFEATAANAKRGDFVYFDPPYAPLSETANFTSYTKDGFADSDQVTLAELCRTLDKRGVKFMLSNSATDRMNELYKDFLIETVQSPRAINSRADRRGKIAEIIVRNYDIEPDLDVD